MYGEYREATIAQDGGPSFSGQDYSNELTRLMLEKNACISELNDLGQAWSQAEVEYELVKTRRAFEMRQTETATFVSNFIKGDPEVAQALLARESSLALYDACKRKIDSLKLDIRVVMSQMGLEMGRQPMM